MDQKNVIRAIWVKLASMNWFSKSRIRFHAYSDMYHEVADFQRFIPSISSLTPSVSTFTPSVDNRLGAPRGK
jgi:hypothetical protein